MLSRKLFNKKTFKQENQKAGLPVLWKGTRLGETNFEASLRKTSAGNPEEDSNPGIQFTALRWSGTIVLGAAKVSWLGFARWQGLCRLLNFLGEESWNARGGVEYANSFTGMAEILEQCENSSFDLYSHASKIVSGVKLHFELANSKTG